ncbi:hypothetical protein DSO57_1000006 [Entomophthora muscae]|uniref:Uncharacterized protein n=1 Tax=Entomophthora muscae TaxID=34485 RepID=A0ACC2SLZ9_9FUNG|nr:hypothetical protein DSO57_1000006 [Entomophthora muscae]
MSKLTNRFFVSSLANKLFNPATLPFNYGSCCLLSTLVNTAKPSPTEPWFTVSYIAIGEALLGGSCREENFSKLAACLKTTPFKLRKFEVIPACREEIESTISSHTKSYDLVLVSGGMGPQHKTKIYEIVAAMYNQHLSYHQPTIDRMKEINLLSGRTSNPELPQEKKDMAKFPIKAKVVYPCTTQWSPIVIVDNQVHIVSSFPNIFQRLVCNYFNAPVAEFLNLNPTMPENKHQKKQVSMLPS